MTCQMNRQPGPMQATFRYTGKLRKGRTNIAIEGLMVPTGSQSALTTAKADPNPANHEPQVKAQDQAVLEERRPREAPKPKDGGGEAAAHNPIPTLETASKHPSGPKKKIPTSQKKKRNRFPNPSLSSLRSSVARP